MDIFDIHDTILNRDSEYVQGFHSIADDDIRSFIRRGVFDDQALWPDALRQLNPAYEKAETVAWLAAQGRAAARVRRDLPG